MKRIYITLLFAFVVFLGVSIFSLRANAADPEIVISWRSNTYTPTWYEGRALPINNSNLDVTFQLISKDKSSFDKIINVSDRQVRWYVNNHLVFRRDGLSNIRIKNEMESGDKIPIKVEVEYNDKITGKIRFVSKTIFIPVVSPKVVIKKEYNNNTLNSVLTFIANPFFFNVSNDDDLNVSWSINHNGINKKNQSLKLIVNSLINKDVLQGLNVGVTIFNKKNILESASYFGDFY